MLLTSSIFYACESDDPIEDNSASEALRLVSILPATGSVGGTAVISGVNFSSEQGGNVVRIGGLSAEILEYSASTLVITLPPNDNGTYEVSVTKGDEQKSDLEFTYVDDEDPELLMLNITPASGYVGNSISIYGDGFSSTASENSVTIGGVAAEITSASRTILKVVTPENEDGAKAVVVSRGTQTATGFSYEYLHVPTLSISSVSPTSGVEGETVTLYGECFSDVAAENIVTIGEDRTAVTVLTATTTQLTVLMPDMELGSHTFYITVNGETVEGVDFEYVSKKYYMSVVAGDGTTTIFNAPNDVDLYDNGTKLWVVDRGLHRIRTIDLANNNAVTDVVPSGDAVIASSYPWQGSFDSNGDFYVVCKGGGYITKVTQAGATSKYDISGLSTALSNPMCAVFDNDGAMYVADRSNDRVIKVVGGTCVDSYTVDDPETLAYDGDDTIWVGSLVYNLYKITLSTGEVTQVAGIRTKPTSANFTNGGDGGALSATIGIIEGIVCAPDGSIYFTDYPTNTVRRLVADENGDFTKGTVSVIAGVPFETAFSVGSDASTATFNYPYGITMADDGETIYFTAGSGTQRILKLYLSK